MQALTFKHDKAWLVWVCFILGGGGGIGGVFSWFFGLWFFFDLQVTEHWNRFPRDVVMSSSLEALKNLTAHGSGQLALVDSILSSGLD